MGQVVCGTRGVFGTVCGVSRDDDDGGNDDDNENKQNKLRTRTTSDHDHPHMTMWLPMHASKGPTTTHRRPLPSVHT